MDYEERIKQQFSASVDAQMQSLELLLPTILDAGNALVEALLNENRILACGNGASGGAAQHFCSKLMNRYERERPPLPAIAINSDNVALSEIAADSSFDDIFSKQLRALGREGDILLTIASSGKVDNLQQAIRAAHARDMKVILLCGQNDELLQGSLAEADLSLSVPVPDSPRVQEVHMVLLHCLCDLIDTQLFGAD